MLLLIFFRLLFPRSLTRLDFWLIYIRRVRFFWILILRFLNSFYILLSIAMSVKIVIRCNSLSFIVRCKLILFLLFLFLVLFICFINFMICIYLLGRLRILWDHSYALLLMIMSFISKTIERLIKFMDCFFLSLLSL